MNFTLILLFILTVFIVLWFLPRLVLVSRWHHFFDGIQFSVQDLYTAIANEIAQRKVPNVRITHTTHGEEGIASAQRIYLRIQHQDFVFELCGAHFGTGSFVSWWLHKSTTLFEERLKRVTWKNKPVFEFIFLKSRFQIDKIDAFQDCVSIAVQAAIEGMTTPKGYRALSDSERRPLAAV